MRTGDGSAAQGRSVVSRAIFTSVLAACLSTGLPASASSATAGWQMKAPVPTPRGGVHFLYQSPVVANGRMYVVHGWVFEYDPATDTWVTHRSSPPTQRPHHATAAALGRIYVIGGSARGEPRNWLDLVDEFNPATREWHPRASMPGARRNAGAVTLGDHIYVLGGEGAAPGPMPIVRYDPVTDAWTTMRASTRVRQCWGAQAIDGKIYLLGNPDLEEPPATLLDIYDPTTDTVVPGNPLPRTRMAFATAVAHGRLLVLGGSPGNNVPLAYVDRYDPVSDTWSTGPDLAEPKCWLGAATLDQTLYVLGGVAGDFSKPAVAMYAMDLATIGRSSSQVETASHGASVSAAAASWEHVAPPGKPVPFAPTINQSGAGGPVFTQDGRTVYLTVNRPAHDGFPDHWVIAASHFENGAWTVPEWLEFSGRHQEGSVVLSADGARLYFWSYRSAAERESWPKHDADIWFVEKHPTGWSTPQPMAAPINSEARDYMGSFAADGTLYFSSKRDGGLGEGDLYRSRPIGDHFGPPENLGPGVNSASEDFGGTLSPDGQMLVFASDRPGGSGEWDLYVSALHHGDWQAPWNLGPAINSTALDLYPGFSPDGRRFFFTSNRNGKMEILEVAADVLRRPRHISDVLRRIEWLRTPQPDSASVRIHGKRTIYVDPVALPDEATAIKADLILLTHPHPDHLDPEMITRLRHDHTRIVTVRGVAKKLGSDWNPLVLAPGETAEIDGVGIEAVIACNPDGGVHRRSAGWAGYVLTLDGVRIYFSGDTSFTPEMAVLRDIDIAVLNGHAPYQMSGAEMVQAVAALRPRFVIPIHWSEADRADIDLLRAGLPIDSELVLLTPR